MVANAILPAAALARWKALEAGLELPTDPAERVRLWLERLAARMVCTGGRLSSLLVQTGLTDIETIAACAFAQLDAGPLPNCQLRDDVTTDLDGVAELAPLDVVEALSQRLPSIDWLHRCCEQVHAELATRLLRVGREEAVETVLGRIVSPYTWLDWLELHAGSLGSELRTRLFAITGDRIERANQRPEFAADLWVRLAVVASDRTLLDRARPLVTEPSAEALANGDEDPRETLAWGLARLGAFDEAMDLLAKLGPSARWDGLLRILPFAPNPAARAAIVDELIANVEQCDKDWSLLVETAPETAEHAFLRLADQNQLDTLGRVVDKLSVDLARRLSAALLDRASALEPRDPEWAERWDDALSVLRLAGTTNMLEADVRRRLVDAFLTLPEPPRSICWELAAVVPDDRAEAVLERSRAGLLVADHYLEREAWIALGLPMLNRVPADDAAAWLELAGRQIVWTGIEGASLARFSPWSAAQQRDIVRSRLAHHQHEFLPEWQLHGWMVALGYRLPPRTLSGWEAWLDSDERARQAAATADITIVAATDPLERAEAQRSLEALTVAATWPDFAHIEAVFAALGRLGGETAIAAGADAVRELLERHWRRERA